MQEAGEGSLCSPAAEAKEDEHNPPRGEGGQDSRKSVGRLERDSAADNLPGKCSPSEEGSLWEAGCGQ